MRTLAILVILIFPVNLKVYTQINDSSNVIFDNIQEMPVFPGGPDSIWCFLENNFNDILNVDQKMITYNVAFFVDSLGYARDFRFISTRPRDINNDRADSLKRTEILRVFSLMPKWELPRQFDKKIKCWISVPIKTPYTEFRCKKKIKNNSH